jgi:hypothetical protein
MLLDFLDDVFLLNFALETAQSILQGFTFLNDYFSHVSIHPQSGSDWILAAFWALHTAPRDYRMLSSAYRIG